MEEILTSYLIIIIIHEIVHLLKFIKDEKLSTTYRNFGDLPNTPKGKEGGQLLIYYLFQKSEISFINYEQSKLLNKPESWEDNNILYNIFVKEDFSIDDNNNENNLCFIKFYLSDSKETKDEGKVDWFDIN